MSRTCADVCVAPDVASRNLYRRPRYQTRSRNITLASTSSISPLFRRFVSLSGHWQSTFCTRRHWYRWWYISCFHSRNTIIASLRYDRSTDRPTLLIYSNARCRPLNTVPFRIVSCVILGILIENSRVLYVFYAVFVLEGILFLMFYYFV